MDFTKFVSLLDSSALWYCRIGAFDDAYEGSFSIPTNAAYVGELVQTGKMTPNEGADFFAALHSSLNNISRMCGFANCWHLNERESAAFWKIYSEDKVAICSTVGRLKGCFPKGGNHRISIGHVEYVEDPESVVTDKLGASKAILTKRDVYEYEREVSAYFFDYPQVEHSEDLVGIEIPSGHQVRVDVDVLIERVIVAHRRPSWFKPLVQSVLHRHGHGAIKVETSNIGQVPVYWRDPVALTRSKTRT